MATRNDSRVSRIVVRDSGNHPRIPRAPRKPARNPSASKPGSRDCDRQDPFAETRLDADIQLADDAKRQHP